MEGERLAACGEHGTTGLAQFATPNMARGTGVDSSRVVTHGSILVNDPTTAAAGAILVSQQTNGSEPSARMPGYVPGAFDNEAHVHGGSAGAQVHAFVPQQLGFPPGFHRPVPQHAHGRHGHIQWAASSCAKLATGRFLVCAIPAAATGPTNPDSVAAYCGAGERCGSAAGYMQSVGGQGRSAAPSTQRNGFYGVRFSDGFVGGEDR